MKILLVEDGELTRRVISLHLDELNVEYDIATNGVQALQQVKENDYDAILLDIGLPRLSGDEVAKIIRAKEVFHNIIIAISDATLPNRELFDRICKKPVSRSDLQHILRDCYERQFNYRRNSPAPGGVQPASYC